MMKQTRLYKFIPCLTLICFFYIFGMVKPVEAGSSKVSSVVITQISNVPGGVELIWKKTSGCTMYYIYQKSGTADWQLAAKEINTSVRIKGLKSGVTYDFFVAGVDKNGNANKSKANSYKKRIRYLDAPVIQEVKLNDQSIKITWNPIPGAVKYRVFYKNKEKWIRAGDTTAVSHVIKGLKTGTYAITVRCIDKTGKNYTSGYIGANKTVVFTRIEKPKPFLVTSNVNQTSKVNTLGNYETLAQAKAAIQKQPSNTRKQWYIYRTDKGKKELVWPSLKTSADRVKKAVDWAVAISRDNRHGYSCEGEKSNNNIRTSLGRWGSKGDYSCSTLVATAYELAGIANLRSVAVKYNLSCLIGNQKYSKGLNAGNISEACKKSCKFTDITSKMNSGGSSALKAGDILITSNAHHVVLYIGNGNIVEAVTNELGIEYAIPKAGDQTGWEIRTSTYHHGSYGKAYRAK